MCVSSFTRESSFHRKPEHTLLHELRCFYDPQYRLLQVRMHLKELMRERGPLRALYHSELGVRFFFSRSTFQPTIVGGCTCR